VAQETVTMTITEALAELKTIKARIEKKTTSLMAYFVRDKGRIDPFADSDAGSTAQFWRRETQAIEDLQDRIIDIRSAIQRANQTTEAEIKGVVQTIADWLTWRREVLPVRKVFYETQLRALNDVRRAEAQNAVKKTSGPDVFVPEYVLAVDEQQLLKDAEFLTELAGALDGRLSLVNATTTITIPM